MTPCTVAVGYQRFGGPCYLQLQGWYPTVTLHSIITHHENLKSHFMYVY